MPNKCFTYWNKEEIQKLKEVYVNNSWKDLLKLFPNRSRSSIRKQANMQGLHKKHSYESFNFVNHNIIKKLAETDKAYIAGFFDGEGCISIHKGKIYGKSINPYHRLTIHLANINENIIDYFVDFFGGYKRTNYKCRGKERPCHYWVISTQKAANFLKLILPYLKIKKEQATIAIEFQSRYSYVSRKVSIEEIETRDAYANKLKALK